MPLGQITFADFIGGWGGMGMGHGFKVWQRVGDFPEICGPNSIRWGRGSEVLGVWWGWGDMGSKFDNRVGMFLQTYIVKKIMQRI